MKVTLKSNRSHQGVNFGRLSLIFNLYKAYKTQGEFVKIVLEKKKKKKETTPYMSSNTVIKNKKMLN